MKSPRRRPKKTTSRPKRRPAPRIRRTRAANDNGRTKKRVPPGIPRRFRALGGVDPRGLPPGTAYPCADPYVGARVAGDDFAGTVLGCATPPEGKHGRHFVVGSVASGRAIDRASREKSARRARFAARYEGPDFDARGGRAKRPRVEAPPPRELLALPAPESRTQARPGAEGSTPPRARRSLPVIQPKTRRRLPVVQGVRRPPERPGPGYTPSVRAPAVAQAPAPRSLASRLADLDSATVDEKIEALAEAVRATLRPNESLEVTRKPYFTELRIREPGTSRAIEVRHTLPRVESAKSGLRDMVGAVFTAPPRPNCITLLTAEAPMGLDGMVGSGKTRDTRLAYLAGVVRGGWWDREGRTLLTDVLAARPDLLAILRVPFGAFRAKTPKPAPKPRVVPLRSIADVFAEDREWSPAPMAPIYSATRADKRPEVSPRRDTSEVAKDIRRDIAAAIRANRLPAGLDASVTTGRSRTSSSIDVRAALPPWMRAWTQPAPNTRSLYAFAASTPDAEAVRERLDWIVSRYHRNDSDYSADLYDVNFYKDVKVGGERADQEFEILAAESAGQVPVDVALTRTIAKNLALDENAAAHFAVFAAEPGRRWTVAAWNPQERIYHGNDGKRRAFASARRMDADSPEDAFAVARELLAAAGFLKE